MTEAIADMRSANVMPKSHAGAGHIMDELHICDASPLFAAPSLANVDHTVTRTRHPYFVPRIDWNNARQLLYLCCLWLCWLNVDKLRAGFGFLPVAHHCADACSIDGKQSAQEIELAHALRCHERYLVILGELVVHIGELLRFRFVQHEFRRLEPD